MESKRKSVLITGAKGFIGRNLTHRLSELNEFNVLEFNREQSLEDLGALVHQADAIVHLAGVNRPEKEDAFDKDNILLTRQLCKLIQEDPNEKHLIFSSSTQATLDNAYGNSKRTAEDHILQSLTQTASKATIYRLPGVFGKWCRPYYNSVVATFCHNVANNIPLEIADRERTITLVYIDDVICDLIKLLRSFPSSTERRQVSPEYQITLGALADTIQSFKNVRENLIINEVGEGWIRALYATYVSCLKPSDFAYNLPAHQDDRGNFVEFLKTSKSGQFSFFTANPGVTRGGHYHHTKTEKFLVAQGKARFRFRNILSNETHMLEVTAETPKVVETVPGWAHDISNIGDEPLIVFLWANENFDPNNPDTYQCEV